MMMLPYKHLIVSGNGTKGFPLRGSCQSKVGIADLALTDEVFLYFHLIRLTSFGTFPSRGRLFNY